MQLAPLGFHAEAQLKDKVQVGTSEAGPSMRVGFGHPDSSPQWEILSQVRPFELGPHLLQEELSKSESTRIGQGNPHSASQQMTPHPEEIGLHQLQEGRSLPENRVQTHSSSPRRVRLSRRMSTVNRSKKLKTVSQFGQKEEMMEGCTVELSEGSIHDSQIRNMNKWLSLKDEKAENQGLEMSSAQTWNFLMQLGVGKCVDSEMIERRLEAMEA
ncbi:hypothetical protein Ancab_013969 [Ancistrocladus abbreviatus]